MQLVVCSMYFFEGLTQQEIAERCGITQPSVSRRISAAQRSLKRHGLPPLRMVKIGSQNGRTLNEDIARML